MLVLYNVDNILLAHTKSFAIGLTRRTTTFSVVSCLSTTFPGGTFVSSSCVCVPRTPHGISGEFPMRPFVCANQPLLHDGILGTRGRGHTPYPTLGTHHRSLPSKAPICTLRHTDQLHLATCAFIFTSAHSIIADFPGVYFYLYLCLV